LVKGSDIGAASEYSTISLIQYKQKNFPFRLFWIVIFAISLFFCVKNIIEIHRIRNERPVMISFAKKLVGTFEIPFAAVTICPEMKAPCGKVNVIEMINRESSNYTSEEIQNLASLSHVCESNLFDDGIQSLTKGDVGHFNVVERLNELSHPFDEMFHKCRFGTWKHEKCGKYFHKVITDVGVCHTFNMLDAKDFINIETMHYDLNLPEHGQNSSWQLEKEYESMKVKVYPRRVLGSGLQSGLSVQLKLNKSMLCSSCALGLQGFRVALHMPVELPELSKQFYNIPFKRETNLIVKPNMIYASKDIRDYEPNARHCYFSKERKLKYYRIYTKANCELECKADYVSSQCGCVKFFMPRSNETIVCDGTQLGCAYRAELNYTTRELQRKLLQKEVKRAEKHGKIKKSDTRYEELKTLGSCNCLASCTNIKYDVEVSQTDYDYAEDG
jgi:amiloride-sensitive sodium channel